MSSSVLDSVQVGSGSYPIRVTFEQNTSPNRFFAIPLIGLAARYIMLIPHLIALYLVAIAVGMVHVVAWVPVLFRGTYPKWAFDLTSGYLRWAVRVGAYFYGLTDRYPPFGMDADAGNYPVQVTFDQPTDPSKLFAIPVLGIAIRYILLIPFLIAAYIIFAIVGVMQLGLWVPVLFTGRYPEAGTTMVGGGLRWLVRAFGYVYGLTDKYPPFRLAD